MITHKILILEEEVVVAEDIRDSLQDAGYKVERANSLSGALGKCSEFEPELVLIGEVSKDGLNEVEAALRILSACSNPLKFIFMVSKPIRIDDQLEKKYQILQKPFSGDQLLQLVRDEFRS